MCKNGLDSNRWNYVRRAPCLAGPYALLRCESHSEKSAGPGLQVHVLTPENCLYPYQVAAREPEHAERSFKYFKNGIALAEELGCSLMEINSGWGYWNEDREEAWKRSADMLSRLAGEAGRHGITLVMESLRPEESQIVTNLAQEKQMLQEVNSPYLKPMADLVCGQCGGRNAGGLV